MDALYRWNLPADLEANRRLLKAEGWMLDLEYKRLQTHPEDVVTFELYSRRLEAHSARLSAFAARLDRLALTRARSDD